LLILALANHFFIMMNYSKQGDLNMKTESNKYYDAARFFGLLEAGLSVEEASARLAEEGEDGTVKIIVVEDDSVPV
jgi:hypothetical protein